MACSGTVVCFEMGGEINMVFNGYYPQRFANYYEPFFWSYGSKPLRITEKRTIIACANLRTLVFIRIYTLAADFYRSSPILGLNAHSMSCAPCGRREDLKADPSKSRHLKVGFWMLKNKMAAKSLVFASPLYWTCKDRRVFRTCILKIGASIKITRTAWFGATKTAIPCSRWRVMKPASSTTALMPGGSQSASPW